MAKRKAPVKRAIRKRRISQRRQKPSHLARNIAYLLTAIFLILTVAIPVAYEFNYMSLSSADALSSIALSMFFSSVAFAWVLRRDGSTVKGAIAGFGLSEINFNLRMAIYGILMFMGYMLLTVVIGLVAYASNTMVSSNVTSVIGGLPLYAIAFVAVIAPINEEIFFRGLASPRIGIILSAILFAVLHYAYGSYVELVVALWFGLVAGYAFKKTKSLYPSIVTHIMVNTTTIFLLIHSGAIAALVFR